MVNPRRLLNKLDLFLSFFQRWHIFEYNETLNYDKNKSSSYLSL